MARKTAAKSDSTLLPAMGDPFPIPAYDPFPLATTGGTHPDCVPVTQTALAAPPPPVSNPAPVPLTIFERMAMDPNVDIVKMKELLAMHERVQAMQAQQAFDDAFAQMMPEIPTIAELSKTDKTTYAALEDIIEAVKPILAKHGFSLHFKTKQDAGIVTVTGMLSRGGHTRSSEFISPPDKTGSKNDIQAIASARSYGRRYVTFDLLCIVTRKEDDDGERAGKDVPDQPAGYLDWAQDLRKAASNGLVSLEAMWALSERPLKQHMIAVDKAKWEAMKVDAAKIDRERRA